jgi:hypothetical protein
VFAKSEVGPAAILPEPIVFLYSELIPNAKLFDPDVMLFKALVPNDVLLLPTVRDGNALPIEIFDVSFQAGNACTNEPSVNKNPLAVPFAGVTPI